MVQKTFFSSQNWKKNIPTRNRVCGKRVNATAVTQKYKLVNIYGLLCVSWFNLSDEESYLNFNNVLTE